jgi:hypothetical protein
MHALLALFWWSCPYPQPKNPVCSHVLRLHFEKSGARRQAVKMALGDAVPDQSRKANSKRILITCASAVALAMVAVCFLASKGTGIENAEVDVKTRMQQLHEQASRSHLRSKTFLMLQGMRPMICKAHTQIKPSMRKKITLIIFLPCSKLIIILCRGSDATRQGARHRREVVAG